MSFYGSSTFKTVFIALFALFIAIAACFSYGGELNIGKEKTLYLYSSSSQCSVENAYGNKIIPRTWLKGESVTVSNEKELKNFLNDIKATEVFSESGELFDCVYYYSPKIRYVANVNGKRVNVHVSNGDGIIKIGAPVIFGDF